MNPNEIKFHDHTLTINTKPRGGHVSDIREIIIDLDDVRSVNTIKLKYDFDRDGWVIEHLNPPDHRRDHNGVYEIANENEWREVSFTPSWSRYPDIDSFDCLFFKTNKNSLLVRASDRNEFIVWKMISGDCFWAELK